MSGRSARHLKTNSFIYIKDLPKVGRYDIPRLEPCQIDPSKFKWVGFDKAGKFRNDCKNSAQHAVHFFIYDYNFEATYSELPRYAQMVEKFGAVCTPDFSMYSDYPDALNIFNHYRKQAVGAFWQQAGLPVIPTANWVWESSYDWCFDGMPKNSTIAVGSACVGKSEFTKRMFTQGFQEMMKRLKPWCILWYGELIKECQGPIFQIPSFSTERWRNA